MIHTHSLLTDKLKMTCSFTSEPSLMEEEENSASEEDMRKVSSLEGNKESVQELTETSETTAVPAEDQGEEETKEDEGDPVTEEEEEETVDDEENDEESKTKKCLGHWESEVTFLKLLYLF